MPALAENRRTQVAGTIALALVLHAPALVRKDALNSDEATIGTIARMIRHGAELYRTAVDRKPPVAFELYRLLDPVFGSWTLTAARWLALACTIGAMWILGFEAHRRWPAVPPAAVAALGIVAFSLLPAEDSRSVGFELLAVLPAVIAFVLGARGRTTLAGVCIGIATLCKQPMLAGAVPLTVQCLTLQIDGVGASWTKRVTRLVLAGAATIVVIVAGLLPFGFADAWHWFAGGGDNYLGGVRITSVVIVSLQQLGSLLGLTMGLVILAIIAWRGRWRTVPADLAVWLVVSLAATALGFRFILHYFNQLLPAMVLLAAAAFADREALRSKLARLGFVWLGGAAAFSLVTVIVPQVFHDLPNVDGVSAEIDRLTTPGQHIFVWGQAPEIYWVSHRDPATRFPHIGFITGITPLRPGVPAYSMAQAGAAAQLLADLEHDHPAVVIDAAIASVRGGDRYPLATSPVASFVNANYCQVDVVNGMRVLTPCTH